MDLIKITPDKERARSILKMISLLEERIQHQDRERMTSLIITDYYEIVKELITAILLIDGYKTLSHKDLIAYVKEHYSSFSMHDITNLDALRKLRNRVAYEGYFVEVFYLDRNEVLFKEIIQKLKDSVSNRL